jgi:hypothetical protein
MGQVRIARVCGCGQSKKLMRGIKGIYSGGVQKLFVSGRRFSGANDERLWEQALLAAGAVAEADFLVLGANGTPEGVPSYERSFGPA